MLTRLFCISSMYLMFRMRRQAASSIKCFVHIVLAVSGAVPALVLLQPAMAEEWTITPSLRVNLEQNDNIRMTRLPHDTVHGMTVAPRLDMGVRSEVWGVTGTAEAWRKRYSGEGGLDQNNETFRLTSYYKAERNTFSLGASRVNDTTLPEEPDDPDRGLVTVQRTRRTENIQPAWTWLVTERSQMQLSYLLSEVSYGDGPSAGLSNYQWWSATATWSYSVTPKSQVSVSAGYTKYRSPDTNILSRVFILADQGLYRVDSTIFSVESETPSYNVGIKHAFSETMRGAVTLGRRKTSTERQAESCYYFTNLVLGIPEILEKCSFGPISTEDTGVTFSGDLKKEFDQFDVAINASRNIAASGAGSEIEKDLWAIRLDWPVTERLKGLLIVNGTESRQLSEFASGTTNIKRYSLQPALNWRWMPEFDVNLSFRYTHLKRKLEDDAVRSRAIYLTLTYTWLGLSVSR